MHTALNMRKKGQILAQERPTRCLYLSSNIGIQVRPDNESKRKKINSNKIALSPAQQEHHQNEIGNKIQGKLCYNPESNLNPHLSIYDSQTNWQRQLSFSVFCNAKYLYEEKNSA